MLRGIILFFPPVGQASQWHCWRVLIHEKKDPAGSFGSCVMHRMDTGQPCLCLSQESNHTSKSDGWNQTLTHLWFDSRGQEENEHLSGSCSGLYAGSIQAASASVNPVLSYKCVCLRPRTNDSHERQSWLTSVLSVSLTKKASPFSPSFMCRLTGSPLISMSTCMTQFI